MYPLIGKGSAYVLSAFTLFASGLWIGHGTTGDHYEGRLARAQAALVSYQAKIALANARLAKAQAEVVTRVEVRYRDRIRVVKEKGDTILKEVPLYVTSEDSARFGVHVGFVRSANAAFSGQPTGSPAESDRALARIPLTEIAQTNAFNARVCHQWQAQALGWRDFYRQLQKTYPSAER